MTDLAKLEAAYATLKKGTLWASIGRCKGFAASNPGEAQKIDAYVTALVSGGAPTPPALVTDTGKGIVGLVDAGFAAIDPPPSPAPTDPKLRRIPVPAYSGAATVVTTLQAALDALRNKTGGELVVRGPIILPGSDSLDFHRDHGGLKVWFEQGARFGGYPASSPAFYGLWLKNGCRNLSMYGLDVTNPAGMGIGVTDAVTNVTLQGRVANVGATCFFTVGNTGSPTGLDIDLDVSDCGNKLSEDPHAEKGTGLHPFYVGSNQYPTVDSKFTFVAHDCDTGSGNIGQAIRNCEFWIDARRLNFAAQSQVAGSPAQFWGDNIQGAIIRYLYAEDCQGRVVEADVLSSGPVTVEYARATRCALNPKVGGEYWDQNPNVSYGDVKP